MIDDIIESAASTYVDVQLDRAAKKHRWARILQVSMAIVSIILLAALVYIVVRYS
jgi:t-SNARE complex subunit (syntaxin)